MSGMTKNWTALVGVAMVMAGSGAAQALPQFTFAPAAAGLTGSSFTADNIQISDFSTIVLTNTSATTQSFTDNGTLSVSNFMIGSGAPVSTPGLNSTYGLYLNFSGTGTQTVVSPGNAVGTFSTLQFTLNAYSRAAGDTITYLPGNSTPLDNGVVITPIELAAGTLIGGTGSVTEANNIPSAGATTTFTILPSEMAFFASPQPFYNLAFSQFGNTSSEVTTTSTGFVINAGGGTINFGSQATPVPEPRSMMLLGASLAAVGLARRAKRS